MLEGGRRQVLITRPEPDAAETARRVALLGWEPVVAPVLEVLHGRVVDAAGYEAVLVTSRNAIPALAGACRGLTLLAVGGATAARAGDAGFRTVLDADGDAAGLAALAASRLPAGSRVLVAHGRGQGGRLVAALRDAGFVVEAREAYAVRAAAALPEAAGRAILGGGLGAALFLSAETARAFVRLLPDALGPHLAGTEALAIGRPAADVLALLPWRGVRVSVRPTLDHVLALL